MIMLPGLIVQRENTCDIIMTKKIVSHTAKRLREVKLKSSGFILSFKESGLTKSTTTVFVFEYLIRTTEYL